MIEAHERRALLEAQAGELAARSGREEALRLYRQAVAGDDARTAAEAVQAALEADQRRRVQAVVAAHAQVDALRADEDRAVAALSQAEQELLDVQHTLNAARRGVEQMNPLDPTRWRRKDGELPVLEKAVAEAAARHQEAARRVGELQDAVRAAKVRYEHLAAWPERLLALVQIAEEPARVDRLLQASNPSAGPDPR